MKILIKDATIINEGLKYKGSVLIHKEKIEKIFSKKNQIPLPSPDTKIIEAQGLYLIPGIIDEQVHFREPGLTHKGDIASESRAAIAGGITSFMEMPNTIPQAITHELLEQKYSKASAVSPANYSFYIGATNNNTDEILKTDPKKICGIKVFMGSSTGDMLVDNQETLSKIFQNAPTIVTTHCEDEEIIRKNTQNAKTIWGDNVPAAEHAHIRSSEACYKSSSKAVKLASKYNTRLHILHLSTAKETNLFTSGKISDKKITSEVCVHHLWFDERDYSSKGNYIKWNPSIKTQKDKEALWEALLTDKIDVIATDHAPHTLQEKNNSYFNCPSGGPLIQHSLVAMLEMSKKGYIPIEKVIQKMCHAPADLFHIDRRGFIREGYFADLTLIDPNNTWEVSSDNLLYKCNWSPFLGEIFSHKVVSTFVNGTEIYHDGKFSPFKPGERLNFIY